MKTILTYTDAPVDYDGFGTRTLRVVGTGPRGSVRLVETPDLHLEWQRARYASGMYLSASESEIGRLTSGSHPLVRLDPPAE